MTARRGSFGLKRPKKVPLTFQEHDALGAELQAMRDRLLKIAVMIGNRYPKRSREGIGAGKALRAVDNLRFWMDGRVGVDCPGLDDRTRNKVYFRGGRG